MPSDDSQNWKRQATLPYATAGAVGERIPASIGSRGKGMTSMDVIDIIDKIPSF